MEKTVNYYANLVFDERKTYTKVERSSLSMPGGIFIQVYRKCFRFGRKDHGIRILRKYSELGRYVLLYAYTMLDESLTPDKINDMISFVDSCDVEVPESYVKWVLQTIAVRNE